MQLVQQYLENNQASWVERGLRWRVPADFPYWIELYKEYKASAGMGSQQPNNNMTFNNNGSNNGTMDIQNNINHNNMGLNGVNNSI